MTDPKGTTLTGSGTLKSSPLSFSIIPGKYRSEEAKHLETFRVTTWCCQKLQEDVCDKPAVNVVVRLVPAEAAKGFHEMFIHNNGFMEIHYQ